MAVAVSAVSSAGRTRTRPLRDPAIQRWTPTSATQPRSSRPAGRARTGGPIAGPRAPDGPVAAGAEAGGPAPTASADLPARDSVAARCTTSAATMAAAPTSSNESGTPRRAPDPCRNMVTPFRREEPAVRSRPQLRGRCHATSHVCTSAQRGLHGDFSDYAPHSEGGRWRSPPGSGGSARAWSTCTCSRRRARSPSSTPAWRATGATCRRNWRPWAARWPM